MTGIQFIFPTREWSLSAKNHYCGGAKSSKVIILFTFFIPSSPRWLLSKDREEDAVAALRRLRPKEDAHDGSCAAEIQAIREALQERVHKAPWTDLVRGTNFRRTMLVLVYYFFQQVRLDALKTNVIYD